jgi:FAD/FMN-containing dehydrogenase
MQNICACSRRTVGLFARGVMFRSHTPSYCPKNSTPCRRASIFQDIRKVYLCPIARRQRVAHSQTRAASSALVRSSKYARLEDRDVAFFKELLGPAGVISDHEDLVPYNTDWMKKYHGQSKLALRPKTTEQVSKILKYCYERCLAVVPQGGNTGLVGGSIAVFDEIVLSLGNLQHLESFVNERGFIIPLDLGAKGTCQIGGNVATNAGGLRLVRYGSLKGSVLGIEAVLADGTVLDTLNTLRKDNTGYDVKQLLIGSEGSLGVITKVAISTPRKPKSVQVAVVGVESWAKVLATCGLAQRSLTEIISAVEFLDQECLALLLSSKMPGCRDPMPDKHAFYILIETSGSNAEHDMAKLMSFLEEGVATGCVVDGVVAQDGAQVLALLALLA